MMKPGEAGQPARIGASRIGKGEPAVPLRVLLVTHLFPPDGVAGVERYTEMVSRELISVGCTVAVLARRLSPSLDRPLIAVERPAVGAEVHRILGSESVDATPDATHQTEQERAFRRVLLEFGPHIVQFNHLRGLSPRLPLLARDSGAATVVALHDFYLACPLAHLQRPSGELCAGPDGGDACAITCFARDGEPDHRWIERYDCYASVLRSADAVFAPSHHVAAFFARLGAVDERIRILPLGVERPPQPTATEATTRSRFTLACLGPVVRHKGAHVVLQALLESPIAATVDLRLMGPTHFQPDYVAYLRRLAARTPGLRLYLNGPYEPGDLPSMLADVDCVITPSQVPESYSITTREALVLGVPVLASRLGALPEVIAHGVNGFTFDAARPSELGRLIERLTGDRDLLAALRRGALLTKVVSPYQHVEQLRSLYSDALSARRQARAPVLVAASSSSLAAGHRS